MEPEQGEGRENGYSQINTFLRHTCIHVIDPFPIFWPYLYIKHVQTESRIHVSLGTHIKLAHKGHPYIRSTDTAAISSKLL